MTAHTLHLNKPNRPKGEPTRVGNLGVFENGGTYEVEELEEDLWIPPNQEGSPHAPQDEDKTPKVEERPVVTRPEGGSDAVSKPSDTKTDEE